MLTGKQMKTYRFIRRCVLLEGRAPTYRRIAGEMGCAISTSQNTVTSICERGWIKRRNGRITLTRDLPAPTATAEFDYFAVDYKNLTTTGWPRLVDVACM